MNEHLTNQSKHTPFTPTTTSLKQTKTTKNKIYINNKEKQTKTEGFHE